MLASNQVLSIAISCYIVVVLSPASSAEITRIVAFGDSYTDSGNRFTASGGPATPYWEGRASNGPVWVEYLADYLGVPRPQASRQGGTNAAFGSATSGEGTFLDARNDPPVEIPRVGAQIDEILTQHTIGPDDLIVLWTGLNDVRDVPGGMLTPDQVVDNLEEHIMTLTAAGATNFLVNNLYNAEPYGPVNALWSARADAIRTAESIRLHRLDFGRLWSQIATSPVQFGFTAPDWRDPIINRSVADPDQHAFWDNTHPTTAFHRVIADAAFDTLRHVDGDYNDNGLVEQADLDLVLLHWGERVTGSFLATTNWNNDLPTRRAVDQDELDRILIHWGESPLVPTVLQAQAAVPEPSATFMLLIGFAALLLTRAGHHGSLLRGAMLTNKNER